MALFTNAEDSSKVHTEWTYNCFENPAETLFGEVCEKFIGIVKDVPTELPEKQFKMIWEAQQ